MAPRVNATATATASSPFISTLKRSDSDERLQRDRFLIKCRIDREMASLPWQRHLSPARENRATPIIPMKLSPIQKRPFFAILFPFLPFSFLSNQSIIIIPACVNDELMSIGGGEALQVCDGHDAVAVAAATLHSFRFPRVTIKLPEQFLRYNRVPCDADAF